MSARARRAGQVQAEVAAASPIVQERSSAVSPAGPTQFRPGLGKRVRASRLLTPEMKRYWLTLLPHLRVDDLRRLDEILRGGSPS